MNPSSDAPEAMAGGPAAASHGLARDARWWPGVARLVLQAAGVAAAPAAPLDLRAVCVLVPRLGHAPLLRAALHEQLRSRHAGRACLAPRIQTLEQWTGTQVLAAPAQRVELYEALRASAWVRERFGTQAGALWSLARDIAQLADELTLAACGAPEAFAGRWRAAVQRHFSARAAAVGDPQAQLVLQLWRAGLAQDVGAARLRAQMERRARQAEGPLIWLLPQGAQPWQRAYAQSYVAHAGHGAWLVEGDAAALGQQQPWLVAAWPELAAPAVPPSPAAALPLAERAAAMQGHAAAPPLRIWRCNSLEDEAIAAAQWTLEQLQSGAATVALVAQDRLAARRVRALLERAGVVVADEAGWKLSTTSAAAALMHWLDLLINDFAHADLFDWLRSAFTLRGREDKAAIVTALEQAMVAHEVHGGGGAVRAALARQASRAAGQATGGAAVDAVEAALQLVDTLLGLARRWQQAATLGRHLALLQSTLDVLDMREPLQADPVGAAVLDAVAQLHEALADAPLAIDVAGFRAFLAEHLESLGQAGGSADAADGRVVMTTLAGTRLRRFDAVLLIGADADHLPGGRAAGGLLAAAVRRELGLATERDRDHEQLLDLASILATAGRTAATWRQRDGDTPRPLAPLLDRLVLLADLAGAPQLLHDAQPAWFTPQAASRPAPPPRAPGQLPARLSASAYQDLIDCPYRFFALRMLGLRETQRLRPRPDKRDLGTALHRVLHEFHRDNPALADSDEPAGTEAALLHTIDAVFAPLLRQRPALLAYRQRLRSLVPGYVHWLAADQGQGWRWLAGECALRRPLPLECGAGGAYDTMELFGRIDRIDADAQGARRILDYKAREAGALRRAQRDPGEATQLLFYGLLADPPAAQAAYLSLQPPKDPRDPLDGVVGLVPAAEPFAEHVAALEQRIVQDLARIGAGASLPANGAETVCRRCELRSLCRHGYTPCASPLVAP